MRMNRGNLAINSHAGLGKDLLLFHTSPRKGYWLFEGRFICSGWEQRSLPDRNGDRRKAIVFRLVLAGDVSFDQSEPGSQLHSGDPAGFRVLRQLAYEAARMPGEVDSASTVATTFERSRRVRDYALARAGGHCECCGAEAPFRSAAGFPFLEVHHIRRLTDGGPDSPAGVAAICPNCHREAHYGEQRMALNSRLAALIGEVEKRTYSDLFPGVHQ
jgi:5-methylcytosine-specific restriction protein A